MKAMLLAAGRGERLRPLTDKCPKPLLSAYPENTSFIERIILRLADAHFTDIVVNVSWLRDAIMRRLGDGTRYGVRIAYSDEGDTALNTGGGIKRALPLLGSSPFLVMNADIYTNWMPRVRNLAPRCSAHLLLCPPPPRHRGDFVLRSGLVTPGTQWTFSGIGYYRPEIFAAMQRDDFPLTDLLRPAIARDFWVGGEVYNGLWIDIGTPERLALARRHARESYQNKVKNQSLT